MDSERAPRGIDITKPHSARRYDYWLHGKDNFEADRVSAEMVAEAFPTIRLAVIENRRFLQRVVRHLVSELGIRQFLDIGSGLPSAGNVHEVAQSIAPESRVVYVDNDPIVLMHARALLSSTPEGATAYLEADLREPDRIMRHPAVRNTLDLTRPVALMLVAVMHFLKDCQESAEVMRKLVSQLPSGSYVVLTHATGDYMTPEERAAAVEANDRSGVAFKLRTLEEFTYFVDGLELVPPGLGSILDWHPNVPPEQRPSEADVGMYGAVARIP